MSPELLEQDVELAALEILESLGWNSANCYEETYGPTSPFGRDNRGQPFFPKRLKAAMTVLNPGVPPASIDEAVEVLTRDRSAMTLVKANRDTYALIKDGIPLEIPNADGELEFARIQVIDFDHPDRNDFFVAQQLWMAGEIETDRADLVGFVNGLPLVFIELKGAHKSVRQAYKDNIVRYRKDVPQFFWFNALIILSNGLDSRVGSVTANYEYFKPWKRVESEDEAPTISVETVLRGVCDKGRLLDIVENFTLFSEKESTTAKIVAGNHQFIGVNNAIRAVDSIRGNGGRLGVFWHTQGSGKSFSMVFFSQKIHRKIPGNWTFLVLTDRNDLDDQIYKTFGNCGVVTNAGGGKKGDGRRVGVQAQDGEHLKQLLTEDHRFVFTLIQKFHTERLERYPLLSQRSNVIVMADEAHRSQYDVFSRNLRDALPNAAFIGFTGTPLMDGEELTKDVFGDYVSVYNFRQAVEDGATVRLFYENRKPELQLANEDFSDELAAIVDDADLDEDGSKAVEREFARQYHLITRDERLETISADIVDHYLGLGYRGKAYVVSIDKITAVRMYDKVKDAWGRKLDGYKAELAKHATDDIFADNRLADTVHYMEETDMAVVVSGGDYNAESFDKKGVNLAPHRARMAKEDLEVRFKNEDDPLRIVFVCAMWLTGFDVPSCSVIYLDKPMRNHSLMQAIARANRVHRDKQNGLIVDYVGVFQKLQDALAVYGKSSGADVGPTDMPVEKKEIQIAEFFKALVDLKAFCAEHGVPVEKLRQGTAREQLVRAGEAVEILISPVEVRKAFTAAVSAMGRVFRAIGTDGRIDSAVDDVNFLMTIAEFIQGRMTPASIDHVFDAVDALLDRSIAAKGYVIRNGSPADSVRDQNGGYASPHRVDLSRIDFDALADHFKKAKNKQTAAVSMASLLQQKVSQMVQFNPTRIDFQERLQRLIEDYNAGTHNTDEFFSRLTDFSKELTAEERRTVTEALSEEELAVFDLLTKPAPELSKKELQQVKTLAQKLLTKLKAEKLVIDWRRYERHRAAVRSAITDVLDALPTAYTDDLFATKCSAIYEHVYEAYWGDGKSRYETTGAFA